MYLLAMGTITSTLLVLVCSGVPGAAAAAKDPGIKRFSYDAADETIRATVLDSEAFYDAGITSGDAGKWLAWLEFVPDQGDSIWVGQRSGNEWPTKKRLKSKPGAYARPTPTLDAAGQLWLSYEAEVDGQWDVFVRARRADGSFGPAARVSLGSGTDFHHRVAADPAGGLWIVWQSDRQGQFDVLARRVGEGTKSEPVVLSDSALGDWHPDVVVAADGTVWTAWDSYDGESYNVLARSCTGDTWAATTTVAASPAFEGWASVAADRKGRVWVAWEEGGINWGKAYRSRLDRDRDHLEIADACGPLHRLRKLHVARIEKDGSHRRLKTPLPQPALAQARQREGRWPGVGEVGAFYERAKLAVDGADRLWVVYRHRYAPWTGVKNIHHLEEDWGIYARCLEGTGWSKRYRFDLGQGDGMQRLSVVPRGDGIALAMTVGRTDRRKIDRPRGVAVATLAAPAEQVTASEPALTDRTQLPAPRAAAGRSEPPTTLVNGKVYQLFVGDLHRHTDLSLCFAPVDGTIDDAYRSAIDASGLDFLGITDHTRDIAKGKALSQLWWRCRKQVTQYRLRPTFIPYFSYERSRGDTDHNVITLRPDMLRPHTYPLPEFWKELDDDTFTIPHQPFNKVLWESHDERRRPLLEIFQGFRDRVVDADAHDGLSRGYRFGFIASSDHLSTHTSFACVWAEQRTRESIFRAMQARRTYGATAKIRLLVHADGHWMGERFAAKAMPPLAIEAEGTAPIETVEIFVDGKLWHTLHPKEQKLSLTYRPELEPGGSHYVYVRLRQADNNQAWASPIWVKLEP